MYIVVSSPISTTRNISRFTILTALATKKEDSTRANTATMIATTQIGYFFTLRRKTAIKVVVINMAIVMENPYAAVMRSEVRKYNTTAKQPTQSSQLMLGM